jgi:hypothetical protein
MSGLGDAHTHLSWNNGDLGKLGELGVEEHTLLTAQSAKVYLDSGYTMCYGAASLGHAIWRMARRWPSLTVNSSRVSRLSPKVLWRCER